jgi:hypothetical protein
LQELGLGIRNYTHYNVLNTKMIAIKELNSMKCRKISLDSISSF